MSEKNGAALQFIGYRVTDITYACAPEFEFPQGEIAYKFNFDKKLMLISKTEIQENLRVNLFYSEDDVMEATPYRMSVEIAGRFVCEDGWQEKWEANVLAIMFPYLRSLVSLITSNSGRDPVILPAVNIISMFEGTE